MQAGLFRGVLAPNSLPVRLACRSACASTTASTSASVAHSAPKTKPPCPPQLLPLFAATSGTPKPLFDRVTIKSISRATDQPQSSTICFEGEDKIKPLTLPNFYLRDSSVHQTHVHPASRQKLFRSSDVPECSILVRMEMQELDSGNQLVMEWDTPLKGKHGISSRLSVVKVDSLVRLAKGNDPIFTIPPRLPSPREDRFGMVDFAAIPHTFLWDRRKLSSQNFRIHYDDYMNSTSSLYRTIEALIKFGIVLVTDVPFTEREGVNTDLRRVVERIGSIRRTWYGDLWDVKAEDDSKNIAYTNLDLGLHMDLTHFESPPRYQFLHCLQNSQVEGGESYFVDSFHVAKHLCSVDFDSYRALSQTPLTFEYENGGHHTKWIRPTLEHMSTAEGDQLLWAVNYSPPFQGPLPHPADPESSSTYQKLSQALKAFADLCDEPSNQYRLQLNPGDCVIFDNRRVLHARTAFEFLESKVGEDADSATSEKGRWLKGAYMDGDEVWSRWRVLEAEKQETELF